MQAVTGLLKPFLKTLAKPVSIFLILFILFFIWQNVNYIKLDTAPKETNDQYSRALEFYRFFVTKEIPQLESRNNYPPLMAAITLPFLYVAGPSEQAARLSLSLFSIVFLLSIYGIGKYFGDEYSGIVAVCLAASSPHVLNLSRLYYLDFPQTALTALAFFFLLKSGSFSNRMYSVLFGLAFSAAFWIKWSAVFFLAGPILYFLIPVLTKISKRTALYLLVLLTAAYQGAAVYYYYSGIVVDLSQHFSEKSFIGWFPHYLWVVVLPAAAGFYFLNYLDKKNESSLDVDSFTAGIKNFYYALSAFVLTIMPFYFMRASAVKCRMFDEMTADLWQRNYMKNLFSDTYAIGTMFSFAIILMAVGIVFMIKNRNDRFYQRLSLIVSLIAGSAILIKIGHTNLRYYLSFIIFTAPLAALWVCYLKKYKYSVTVLMLVLSVISMANLTYGGRWNSPFLVTIASDLPPMLNKTPIVCVFGSNPPDSREFFIDEIFHDIPTETPGKKRSLEAKILVFLAEPDSGMPFGVEYIHQEAKKRHLLIRAVPFCMKEPVNEMEKTLLKESKDDQAFVFIVFNNLESYRKLMGELEMKYKNINMSGKFIDIGSGYFVRLARVAVKG